MVRALSPGHLKAAWNTVAALAVVVAINSPRAAKAFDDPAVAACEWMTQHYDVLPAQEYRRVSASLSGNTVKLTYQVAALNTAPEAHTKICRFERQGKSILFERPKPPAGCDKVREDATAAVAFPRTDPRRGAIAVALQDCMDKLQAALNQSLAQISNEFPLMETGIYPIDPAKTALVVP